MGLKEEFKKYIAKKKDEHNLAILERQLHRDLKEAKILLNKGKDFSIRIRGILNGQLIDRIIDDHNLEYCFLNPIWKSLSNAEKIAVMIKFSQKNTPDYPLTLDSFAVCDKYNHNDSLVKYNALGQYFYAIYNHIDFNYGPNVLRDLIGYKDMAKEELFLQYIKKEHDISDFEGIWQLRYFYQDEEHLLLDQYPNIANDSNIDRVKIIEALAYDSAKSRLALRITLKQLDVLGRVGYFMPEFRDYLETFKNKMLGQINREKELAEKYFGTQEERDINFLKSFNNTHLKGKYTIEELTKMFKPGKMPEPNEDPFKNIKLADACALELQ